MYIPTLYFGSGNYIPCNGILAWYNFPIQQTGSDFTYTKCTGNDAAFSKTCYNFRHRYDNLITTNSNDYWPDTGELISPSLQLYVLDDVNPINSTSGSDPNAPYIISSSLGEPVIGVKSWYLASSSYSGSDLQPWPIGAAASSTPRILFPFFTSSEAFAAFPTDTNQVLDTTVVMTGKLNYNANTSPNATFIEYQVDNGVGEGPLATKAYFKYDELKVFAKTGSVGEVEETYQIQSSIPDFHNVITQSLANNTNGIETFIFQIDSQGSITSENQTVYSMRSSCLNNFRDVYYYQKAVSPSGDETHIQMNVGYNRSGGFGTGSQEPFEYQVAHQHYTRLLTTAEMNKAHLANISSNTNLQDCQGIILECQEYSFNAGPDGGTASYELCGTGQTTEEILTSGSSVVHCVTSGSTFSITGAGSNISFVKYCNQ